MEDCDPITDAVASDWYRRRMVGVFVRRALTEIAAPAAEGRA
jgi:CO/xanthine dehydrogenase FAD-binding subunit